MFPLHLTAAAFMLFMLQYTQTNPLRENLLCFAEDSDIKIFGGEKIKTYPKKDVAEQDADEYMQHKLSGNIDIAKDLGKDLAELVINYRSNHALAQDDSVVMLQCKVLFLHAACTCAVLNSPSSIISDNVTQVLLDTVRDELTVVYDNYKGLGSATMYKLAEKEEHSTESIGKLFARLCSQQEHQRYITFGIELYEAFLSECEELCKSVSYREI
ncbi:MAG: hypothetical protein IKV41_02850 [Oscillospiraceae bacterium]|nr:hypothetical protein [Oscillospiraceae bacterium]